MEKIMGIIKKHPAKTQSAIETMGSTAYFFEEDTEENKKAPKPVIKGISNIKKKIQLDSKVIKRQPKITSKPASAIFTASEPVVAAPSKKQMEQEVKDYKQQYLKDLEIEKKQILDKAYQEGYQQGAQTAEKKGAEKYTSQSQELLKTIGEAVSETNKILKKARGEILNLSLKIAEQIIKSEISLNQAVCVNIVAEALGKITDKDRVIVRVNRADLDFVKANRDRIDKQLGGIKNLIIQEDYRVDQGGCIIETNLGYIDSTIAAKLDSIKKAIYQVYEEEQHESETTQ